MGTGDISLACATALIDELVEHGMRHACVSPGLAFDPARARAGATPRRHGARPSGRALERVLRARAGEGAAPSGRGRVHERHGGGGAVPRGRRGVAGARAALPADRRPAPAAARHRREPDDRPGAAVRHVRAGVPRAARSRSAADDALAWRRAGREAVAACGGPQPGPVHVNCSFEEPLVPTGDHVEVPLGIPRA